MYKNNQDIQITEKKLEDFIFEHLIGINIIESLPFDTAIDDEKSVYRQLNLGSFGIIDIVTFSINYDGRIHVDIYELKKGKIGRSSLIQILRYKKGIQHFFGKNSIPCSINCYLIGGVISEKDGFGVAISGTIDFLSIYLYDICPNNGFKLYEESRIFTRQKLPYSTKHIFSCLDYKCKDQLFSSLKDGGK